MMRVLVVFFCAAVALTGTALWRHQERIVKQSHPINDEHEVFRPGFDIQKVTELVITTPQVKIHARFDNGIWMIINMYGGMPAEVSTVMNFLGSLLNVRGELRSAQAGLLEEYGLDDARAIRVEVLEGDRRVEDFYLGVAATDGKRDNFLRRFGSSSVYMVADDILNFFGIRPDAGQDDFDINQWLDKRIVSFNPDTVRGIRISEGGAAAAGIVQDNAGVWRFARTYAFMPDTEKVTNYIKMTAGLQSFAIVSPELMAFDDRDWTLTLEREGSEPITLQRKFSDDGKFYVRVSGKPYLYQIAVYHFANLAKTDGEWFVDNPLGIDDKKLTDIKVDYRAARKKMNIVFTESKGWHFVKGKSIAKEKIERGISFFKNLPLMTPAKTQPKSETVLTVTLTQDKKPMEFKVRNNTLDDPSSACFPVMVNKEYPEFCIEEGQMRSLIATLEDIMKDNDK